MNSRYADEILRALRRISRAIDLYSRRLASRYGLTTPQLVCLREIAAAGEIGPGQLARLVDLSQATVTGVTDRLARNGMVTRARNDADRRRVVLRLTAAGEELVANAPSPLQERLADNLARIPIENQQVIATILGQVVGMMGAEQMDASAILASGPPTASAAETEQWLHPSESNTAEE